MERSLLFHTSVKQVELNWMRAPKYLRQSGRDTICINIQTAATIHISPHIFRRFSSVNCKKTSQTQHTNVSITKIEWVARLRPFAAQKSKGNDEKIHFIKFIFVSAVSVCLFLRTECVATYLCHLHFVFKWKHQKQKAKKWERKVRRQCIWTNTACSCSYATPIHIFGFTCAHVFMLPSSSSNCVTYYIII